ARGASDPFVRLPGGARRRSDRGVLVHVQHADRRRRLRVARPAHLLRGRDRMSEATLPVVLRVPQAVRASAVRYFARSNARMILGGALVLTWLALAAFAPFIAPHHPLQLNPTDALHA